MRTKAYPREEQKHHSQAYIYVTGLGHKKSIEVGTSLSIGRHFDCGLRIEDDYTSTQHARIFIERGRFVLKDLGSSNGTFLNGCRVMQAELQNNDRIRIGKTDLLFSYSKDPNQISLFTSSKNKAWNTKLQNLVNIAKSEFPVLIIGESGTGKELISQLIHKKSGRSMGPLVSVNCSALSESLIESELFGHIKGSFTGADSHRKGAFESARGGTLFLDEIGDLPMTLQPKLLRALENKEIKAVGSDTNVKTDVRIIAATHNTLAQKVADGNFREDLYYRLNVIQVNPPRLVERLEDFEDLLYHFAKEHKVKFDYEAVQKLKKHPWPGNIRELKNFVARASAIYSSECIDADKIIQLLDKACVTSSYQDYTKVDSIDALKLAERNMICKCLKANAGNQRKTAAQLGMPKSTLHDRIRSYKINIKELLAN